MNWTPNWTQITRNLEAVAAVGGAAGVALGGVEATFQPLAVAIPALAPFAPVVTAISALVFFLANGARKGVEGLKARGLDKVGPR